MALDEDRLGTAIAAAVTAARPDEDVAITNQQLIDMWKVISGEIIDEFKDNAVVTTAVTSGSSAGSYEGTIE